MDHHEQSAAFEHVTAQIRDAIDGGEARPGERLPPARDIAAELGVDTTTVVRSLHRLSDEGLLRRQRWRGVRVAGASEPIAPRAKAR